MAQNVRAIRKHQHELRRAAVRKRKARKDGPHGSGYGPGEPALTVRKPRPSPGRKKFKWKRDVLPKLSLEA